VGAAAVVVISFCVTTLALNYWSGSSDGSGPPGPSGDVLAGKAIATSGDATASTLAVQDDTLFQFKGNGFARINGTSGLKCLTNKCSFAATVTFTSATPDKYEIILGQSFNGELGWHLLWTPGALYLQPDGGGKGQIVVPFTPRPEQKYLIDVVNTGQEIKMSIDGKVVGTSNQSPMTDIVRDVTVGGRDGTVTNGFAGTVSDFRMRTR
jgi:hypothetical protein